MTDFQRTLRALTGPEMDEWAAALLRRLNGAGEGADAVLSLSGTEGAEAPAAAAEPSSQEALSAQAAEAVSEAAKALTEADAAERESLALRLERLSRERSGPVPAGETEGAETRSLPFSGPELRYENAVGGRGMEMERLSAFFRRDSRRYDAGFRFY